jgi:hypothetical protein
MTLLRFGCARARTVAAPPGFGLAILVVACTQLQPHHTVIPGHGATAANVNCAPDPMKNWTVAPECASLLVERTHDYDLYFHGV